MNTTDDFTKAARAEAEDRHPAFESPSTGRKLWPASRDSFIAAAEWARTHLTARMLPDPNGGCVCTVHEQDAGAGYTERLTEYEPACPEHSEHVYNPRTGTWESDAQEPTEEEVEAAHAAYWPAYSEAVRNASSNRPGQGISAEDARKAGLAGHRAALTAARAAGRDTR